MKDKTLSSFIPLIHPEKVRTYSAPSRNILGCRDDPKISNQTVTFDLIRNNKYDF